MAPEIFLMLSSLVCAAPAESAAPSSAAVQAVSVSTAAVAKSTEAVPSPRPEAVQPKRGPALEDVYWVPENARDPFAPVPVQTESRRDAAKASKRKEVKFSMDNLELVGILAAGQGFQAVLTDKDSGASYFLMRGFIFDKKLKPVEGYSGVIEGKTATVTGPGGKVRTLKLPEKKPGKQL